MFWRIFTIIVFVFTIIDGIVYFRNERKSKKIVEDILKDEENKQFIVNILSSDSKDLHKINVLRNHFNINLDEAVKISSKYKKHEI
ncbi:hypothetical protein [Apilactobacillus micheneri]|uniref:hypothetical protein n=1 Tax=Apilactobacillus micheneri TaxID=1899430 RepID=UPI000D5248D0|nr:hypothetical protein [Apilactobacillus micheneri]GAY79852.1 hypothetical protein NBRC113063_00716 [Apilactobacillus micheneri]